MSSSRAAGHCKLGPSASLDLSDLEELANQPLDLLDSQSPNYLHLDVSDGRLFSPVTFGIDLVKSLRARLPNAFIDVHLMVRDPHKCVDEVANAGADQLTFHVEATDNLTELISCVRGRGKKVGVAIKSATSVKDILPYITQVDSVLVMTAEPGCKGQEFTTDPTHKMEAIRQACPDLEVKTDGWWEELSQTQVHANGSGKQHSTDTTAAAHPDTQLTVTFEPTTDTPTNACRTVITCTCTSTSYGTVHTCSCPVAANGGGANRSPTRTFNKGGIIDSECQPLIINATATVHRALSQSGTSSVQCRCHTKVEDDTAKRAKVKLVLAAVIALLFVIGEVVGGYFAGSLAIMTDAAHMLSDFASFLISLFAIWLGSRPSSKGMSFGWYRAEVLGAVISVLVIWLVTGVLVYEAVLRVIHPERYHIDANIMLITACVGVYVNVLMCTVLHPHSHGHGHGHSKSKTTVSERKDVAISLNEVSSPDCEKKAKKFWQRKKSSSHKHDSHENINVRAAFIHVIGDLIQSVGVVIAGYIIWFKPEWKIADPICTFLFSALVLISTVNVLKDALRVLMEGTPKHINYQAVKNDLVSVPGVRKAHSLHIWSLTLNKTALAAHLVLDSAADHQTVLDAASKMLRQEHNITSTTLQVEGHHDLMENCDTCQETDKTNFCWPL